ncbi:hypothetical protein [Halomicrococcus sp. SG-WS-1]|uniref:hypothetical protein n=1 Tax=Halomicrococcus sp. SG-WS-1 TaxID=3439057 RepID=UPI003F7AEC4A
MEPGRLHALGTASLAAGTTLLVLSLPVIVASVAGIADGAPTVDSAIRTLTSVLSTEYAGLDGTKRLLYLGVVGVGVSLWLLGAGLLLQARAERRER